MFANLSTVVKGMLTIFHSSADCERIFSVVNKHKMDYQPNKKQLECGPMPNVMAALPNIGGAVYGSSVIPFLVPRGKVWLTPAAGVPCSNAGNIR